MTKEEKTRYTFEHSGKVIISGKSFEDTQTIVEGNNYTGKLYQIIKFPDTKVVGIIIKGSTKKSLIFNYNNGEIQK